ncbi:MAG: coenzyme F420-0:L-glutamate ligase [Candidatus Devosia euplotis]|nr:coenzyme F420-0:L-glutamate ligase [Candidatus Devosia euplotis]
MSLPRYMVWDVTGLPEIEAGDDLVAQIVDAITAQARDDAEAGLRDGDAPVVTSKIVSKAEGQQFPAADRNRMIAQETVRVVAERVHAGGVTQIVETRHGLIVAAAGIDTSNVPDGVALRLPVDPDASARACGRSWGLSLPTRWAGHGGLGRRMSPSARPGWW